MVFYDVKPNIIPFIAADRPGKVRGYHTATAPVLSFQKYSKNNLTAAMALKASLCNRWLSYQTYSIEYYSNQD